MNQVRVRVTSAMNQMVGNISAMEDKAMRFWITRQPFNNPIRNTEKIVNIQNFTAIPKLRTYVKGTINLRIRPSPPD